jgi:hypothetical protein
LDSQPCSASTLRREDVSKSEEVHSMLKLQRRRLARHREAVGFRIVRGIGNCNLKGGKLPPGVTQFTSPLGWKVTRAL